MNKNTVIGQIAIEPGREVSSSEEIPVASHSGFLRQEVLRLYPLLPEGLREVAKDVFELALRSNSWACPAALRNTMATSWARSSVLACSTRPHSHNKSSRSCSLSISIVPRIIRHRISTTSKPDFNNDSENLRTGEQIPANPALAQNRWL
jgi:hypothetical protein